MLIEETDNRFYVTTSTISGAGSGLFAQEPIAEGDTLEVIGVLVLANSISDRCTHYADRYKFRVDDYLLIPIGYGAMMNHSKQPNMVKVIEGQRVYLRALRAIAADEELFFQYSDFAVAQMISKVEGD